MNNTTAKNPKVVTAIRSSETYNTRSSVTRLSLTLSSTTSRYAGLEPTNIVIMTKSNPSTIMCLLMHPRRMMISLSTRGSCRGISCWLVLALVGDNNQVKNYIIKNDFSSFEYLEQSHM